MLLRLSTLSEVKPLTKMSIDAFHTDYLVGLDPLDGPPDYDSVEWHEEMLNMNNLYSYLDDEGNLVGGCVLFNKESLLYIGRIFIDPIYFRKGYGYQMMKDIEEEFIDVKTFKLDTPLLNVRTNALYKKLGYQEVERNCDTVTYIKKI